MSVTGACSPVQLVPSDLIWRNSYSDERERVFFPWRRGQSNWPRFASQSTIAKEAVAGLIWDKAL